MMRFIAAFLLAASLSAAGSPALGASPAGGRSGHLSRKAPAAHRHLACAVCHRAGGTFSDPAARENRAAGCVACHRGYEAIFDRAMATRSGERQFVAQSWGKADPHFFDKNCASCHLQGCLDCHGAPHAIARPATAACQACHRGYFIGWDFSGRAPREDNRRFQRGIAVNGETFLKMLPDVHYRAGMVCGDCHSMQSLMSGQRASKRCLDCHTPSPKVVEHRIAAHLERLECYACHSSWSAQEYGTFFLRFSDPAQKEEFDLKPGGSNEYLRSAYLKRQDAPPLGFNAAGRLSPIRPQFLAYYTDIGAARRGGGENILLAAQWRAVFPHTISRGTLTCEGCHDNPGRFLLEPPSKRIYRLQDDGMGLASFWTQDGQRLVNGTFMEASRYLRLSTKGAAYQKAYIEKWKTFLKRVVPSSSD